MADQRRIAILGSTGSIGTQTLDIVAGHPDRFKVVALAARSNESLLNAQAARFGVTSTCLFDRDGMEKLVALATAEDVDLVVVSVAGVIGLLPTIEAIKAGKAIALASKEVLVAAGEFIMPLVAKHGTRLTPIDSEHSAIFQCMQGYQPEQVDQLILTASGGPFRGWKRSAMAKITVAEALAHPTWAMGGKITVDSATLMNKALETIEARWLFGIPIQDVCAIIHPQSVIHSMVKFKDGSVIGQMGWPNMRLPILYALSHPDRVENDLRPWNPFETPSLTFEEIDNQTFPALVMARDVCQIGGTMPSTFNAANEIAANAFLTGGVGFLQITEIVARTLEAHPSQPATLESILAADSAARVTATAILTQLSQ